jgi:hypothetical protein
MESNHSDDLSSEILFISSTKREKETDCLLPTNALNVNFI